MFQIIAIIEETLVRMWDRWLRMCLIWQSNYVNFRKAKYIVHKETREVVIDRDFVKNIPIAGSIDFDYVSTTRPSAAWIDGHRTALHPPPLDPSAWSRRTSSSTSTSVGVSTTSRSEPAAAIVSTASAASSACRWSTSRSLYHLTVRMRGDQPDKANEKYSIDKLTRLQRAMMNGINGGLLRSAFKKSKKTFKTISKLYLTSMYHSHHHHH